MGKVNWPNLETADGRRAWALLALVGGAAVNSAFAGVAMWLVSTKAGLVFWLGMAAQVQVLVILTGLCALLVKRSVKVTRESVEIMDQTDDVPPL